MPNRSAGQSLSQSGATWSGAVEKSSRTPTTFWTMWDRCVRRICTEQRQLELLACTLARAGVARAYAGTYALCLRHVLAVRDARAATLVRGLLRTHLKVVQWELEEAAHKRVFYFHHEQDGSERTALMRLAALVDGETFLGVPVSSISMLRTSAFESRPI